MSCAATNSGDDGFHGNGGILQDLCHLGKPPFHVPAFAVLRSRADLLGFDVFNGGDSFWFRVAQFVGLSLAILVDEGERAFSSRMTS